MERSFVVRAQFNVLKLNNTTKYFVYFIGTNLCKQLYV